MDFATLLNQQPDWMLYLTTGLVGLLVGSFLNVVIHRLPIMLERQWHSQCRELLEQPDETSAAYNLVTPRSRCPHCDHLISASWENIPLLSYLLQRGRCRHCQAAISIRYPIVELASAALSLACLYYLGPSLAFVAAVLFSWLLICLTFIDADTQLLPDDLTLPLLWLGLLASLGHWFSDPVSSIIGATAGYLSLWSVYQLFRLITGREGMGFGDFKLLAALGAWLGWQMLPLIVILASAIGALWGIFSLLFRGHGRGQPMPFGPFLAGAGWVALLWGPELIGAYLQFTGLG